jgi:hypothetical protein
MGRSRTPKGGSRSLTWSGERAANSAGPSGADGPALAHRAGAGRMRFKQASLWHGCVGHGAASRCVPVAATDPAEAYGLPVAGCPHRFARRAIAARSGDSRCLQALQRTGLPHLRDVYVLLDADLVRPVLCSWLAADRLTGMRPTRTVARGPPRAAAGAGGPRPPRTARTATRAWITDILAGNPLSDHCPGPWRNWITGGHYQALTAARIEYRPKAEQLPADPGLDEAELVLGLDDLRGDRGGLELVDENTGEASRRPRSDRGRLGRRLVLSRRDHQSAFAGDEPCCATSGARRPTVSSSDSSAC